MSCVCVVPLAVLSQELGLDELGQRSHYATAVCKHGAMHVTCPAAKVTATACAAFFHNVAVLAALHTAQDCAGYSMVVAHLKPASDCNPSCSTCTPQQNIVLTWSRIASSYMM